MSNIDIIIHSTISFPIDSQNTKRPTKVEMELFTDYIKEKKQREPEVFLQVKK